MKRLLSITKQADGFLKKYALRYDIGGGETYDWEMVSPREIASEKDLATSRNAVELIGRFPNGDFLLIREFRYPVNDYCYSFPTGMIDRGETVEDAVKRELYEETGAQVVSIDRMPKAGFFAAGLTDELIQLVYLTVDGALCAHPEGMEDIVPCRLSADEVKRLLSEKDARFTLTCLAILDALLFG